MQTGACKLLPQCVGKTLLPTLITPLIPREEIEFYLTEI